MRSLGAGAAGLGLSACGLLRRERPANVVIILADDLGYGDLGCYGAMNAATPNLDRLAAEGLRFTDFYVPQAVCSASRAALLTGCYPNRISLLHALMPQAENGISPEEETIAELLRERGYACGVFGKWHLGHHPEFLPLRHGFDEYFGLPYSNDMWPVGYDGVPVGPDDSKARHPYPPLIDGERKVGEVRTLADQDGLTGLYTARAVRFIEKNKDRPFFLYVPHSMVHVPLGVSAEFRDRSGRGLYGDVLMELDDSVGRILGALKKAGLDRRTLVVFLSDNGPWLNFGNHAGSAGPLLAGADPARFRLPGDGRLDGHPADGGPDRRGPAPAPQDRWPRPSAAPARRFRRFPPRGAIFLLREGPPRRPRGPLEAPRPPRLSFLRRSGARPGRLPRPHGEAGDGVRPL